MSDRCLACDRIEQIKQGVNPYFVKELETGYVVIGDFQFFKGYTLLLCKHHVPELHQLDRTFRLKFLEEMTIVSEAVWKWVSPKILNYEALGNDVEHLHWHIFPRYADDPNPKGPTWQIPREERCAEKYRPTEQELSRYKKELLTEIDKLLA